MPYAAKHLRGKFSWFCGLLSISESFSAYIHSYVKAFFSANMTISTTKLYPGLLAVYVELLANQIFGNLL